MMDSGVVSTGAGTTSPAERRTTAATALAALGIVYGDLGTSPLYTYQTIVGAVGGHPSASDAIGLRHAIGFLGGHGWHSFVVLGGVFLAITGGEALYADMGHLGRNPDPLLVVLRRAAGPAAELWRADRAADREP